MKKLLSMALALVMICSLFAVPAMAATVALDLVKDGTFEASVNGAAVGAKSATSYGIGSYGTAVTKTVDGSMVYAATAASNSRASYATNTISVTEGETFTLTFDVYATSPNAAEGTTARIDFEDNGQLDHASRTWSLTDLSTGEAITDLNASNRQRVYFPINKWVRISVPMKALTTNTAAYAELVFLGTTASAEVLYLDNVSLTKQVEGYNVNVTEKQPTLGTVTAPAFAAGTGTTITVTPESGYYLYSATLNGTDIKDSFTKANGVYTYALDGTNVTADPNLVVSYGVYNTRENITGGDMSNATALVTKRSNAVIAQGTEGYNDTTSALITNSSPTATSRTDVYVDGPALADGTEHVVSFDVKNATSVQIWEYNEDTTFPDNGNKTNPSIALTAGEWNRVSLRAIANNMKGDYALRFAHAAGAQIHLDNFSIITMTEGGEVPVYYDINVTENADNGTVTAPARVAEGETAEIKVAPDFGYYLASATLNGTDVTGSFVKTYAEDLNAGEVYTYTLANADAASSFAITYGQYYKTEYVTGGDLADSETAAKIVTPYSGSHSVSYVTTEGNGDTNSVQISGRAFLEGPTGKAPGDEYIASFDIKGVTSVRVWPYNDKGTLPAYEKVNHTFSGLTADEWTRISVRVVLTEGGNRFVLAVEAAGAYIDNVSIATLSKTAPAPTTATVTISGDNAVTSVANGTVAIGGTTTFTVAPMLGYYIESITIGGEDFLGFNAYEKDTYTTEAINEDTEIVVTTAAVADKGDSVATLADVFTEATTAVTFGKVLDDEATEYGIYLTNEDGDVVTEKGTYGPYFAADAKTEDGQYAIEFVGLATGTYTAITYVMVDGTPIYGAPVTFVVE